MLQLNIINIYGWTGGKTLIVIPLLKIRKQYSGQIKIIG